MPPKKAMKAVSAKKVPAGKAVDKKSAKPAPTMKPREKKVPERTALELKLEAFGEALEPESRGPSGKLTVSEVQKNITNCAMDAECKISTQEQRELDAENKESQLSPVIAMLENVLDAIKRCKEKKTEEFEEEMKNFELLKKLENVLEAIKRCKEKKTEEFEEEMKNFELLQKRSGIEQPGEDVDMEEGGGEICTDRL